VRALVIVLKAEAIEAWLLCALMARRWPGGFGRPSTSPNKVDTQT